MLTPNANACPFSTLATAAPTAVRQFRNLEGVREQSKTTSRIVKRALRPGGNAQSTDNIYLGHRRCFARPQRPFGAALVPFGHGGPRPAIHTLPDFWLGSTSAHKALRPNPEVATCNYVGQMRRRLPPFGATSSVSVDETSIRSRRLAGTRRATATACPNSDRDRTG